VDWPAADWVVEESRQKGPVLVEEHRSVAGAGRTDLVVAGTIEPAGAGRIEGQTDRPSAVRPEAPHTYCLHRERSPRRPPEAFADSHKNEMSNCPLRTSNTRTVWLQGFDFGSTWLLLI
jgi:hypothetical protein